MKIAIIVILALPLAGIIAFFVLGLMSQSGSAIGLVEGKLSKCPDNPNCICTEYEADVSHYIDPITLSESKPSDALSSLKKTIQEMGGSIQSESESYLAATFTSPIFRFVDDLEIRIDTDQKIIHLRSASRVGYGDRGVNRKRVKRLKNLYP